MTRKDYELIARAINEARYILPLPADDHAADMMGATFDVIIGTLAKRLHGDNPRFDAARFVAVCGQHRA